VVEREGRAGWKMDRGCRRRRPERIDRRDERQRRRLYAARAAEAVVHVSRRFRRGQRVVALTDGRRDGVRDKPEGIQRAQARQGKIHRGPPKEDHGNNPEPGAKRFSSHCTQPSSPFIPRARLTPRAPVLFRRLALPAGSPHSTPGAIVLSILLTPFVPASSIAWRDTAFTSGRYAPVPLPLCTSPRGDSPSNPRAPVDVMTRDRRPRRQGDAGRARCGQERGVCLPEVIG